MGIVFGLIVLVFIVGIGLSITALIVAIVALNRASQSLLESRRRLREGDAAVRTGPALAAPPPAPPTARPAVVEYPRPVPEPRPAQPATTVGSVNKDRLIGLRQINDVHATAKVENTPQGSLEQRIGTRWVLIAGIITVIFGVGFFLKYAYDNVYIGPLGRVAISAVFGVAALVFGEVTRRRGYGIVARAVTALGFAVLYMTVFSAHSFYGLIDSTPAFGLAIMVTAAAILYAVSLDELLIAALSLVGGFLTPIIVSTGENLPVPLFSYVLVLGAGGMLSAYYRKWRAIDLIAMAGSFVLYAGWFQRFYEPTQMSVALIFLVLFFALYLVMPLMNSLVRKVVAKQEDVLLVLANAAITFVFLWIILFKDWRVYLAFSALGLCAAHLVMASVVVRRCSTDDRRLRLALLVIGLFFLTIAIPLYLRMHALAIAWAAQALVLAVIGVRYRSYWTQAGAAAAGILSFGQLINMLPMHEGAFMLIFNPAFGTWVFVAGAIVGGHLLYRRMGWRVLSEVLYCAAALVLMAACIMEWYLYCAYNLADAAAGKQYLGIAAISAAFILLLVVRPIRPSGSISQGLALLLAVPASLFVIVWLPASYQGSFPIFANLPFVAAAGFAGVLLAVAYLVRKGGERDAEVWSWVPAIGGIVVLLVLLTQQIWLYFSFRHSHGGGLENWRFLANMYISIMWAIYGAVLMIAGFTMKSARLRYLSLGLFALLLVKVFLLDTSNVPSVYRIAAFIATGLTLVGVSYLYQYLRKSGFFNSMLADLHTDDKKEQS